MGKATDTIDVLVKVQTLWLLPMKPSAYTSLLIVYLITGSVYLLMNTTTDK